MANSLNQFTSNKETQSRLEQQEWLIINVTESILEELERQGQTITKLAKMLGKTKGYISGLLGGTRNMTLRTLADLAHSLDMEVVFTLKPKHQSSAQEIRSNMPKQREVVSSASSGVFWHEDASHLPRMGMGDYKVTRTPQGGNIPMPYGDRSGRHYYEGAYLN